MGQLCSRILPWSMEVDMADTPFDVNRTIKVSGISVFLKDVFTKYFQVKNETGPACDVHRVYVCPDGKDCVLVEFSEDRDRNCIKVQTIIEVEGAFLTVNPIESSTVSTEDADVSKVWSWPRNYERPIENGDEDTGELDFDDNKEERKVYREQKRTIDKQNRHEKFHEKRGHQEDSRATECLIFEDTKVKVKNWKKVVGENESKAKEMLEKEKVKLDEKGYLTGSWNAVLNVFDLLRSILYREDDASKSRYQKATQAQSSSSELNCDVCKPSILVEALLFRYINTFRGDVYRALEDVSKEIKFKIISPSERKLKVVARGDVDEKLFREKYNKFIDCYQELYPDMHEKVITLDSIPSESLPIADIVSETQGKFAVIVTFCQEKYQITVYGKKEVVPEASSFINGRVRGISKESKNVGTENRNGQLMQCNLSKNVKLFVYQGDITEEKADAIVNPANEDLNHCGGAAKAISDRGGKTIQDESDDIMRKRRRKLQPGEVETTTAGKLPCKFVVHALGPQWCYHSADGCRKLLQKAVVNSLMTASKNQARIIAIPAISSGVYGVPVKICAEVLFHTVQEFAKSATDSEILQEIRFVNIDKMTTQVFEGEMRKRYGDAVSGGKETSNQNSFGFMNKGGKSATTGRNLNHNSQENVRSGKGRGRGAQHSNTIGGNGSGGNSNSKSDDQRYQTRQNASASTNDNTSPGRSYSQALEKGLNTHNDNTATNDTSKCSICLDAMTNPKKLSKCGHSFCTDCIDNAFKHQQKCPICLEVYGVITGNQPPGQMTSRLNNARCLSGFQGCGTITINYQFGSGTQGPNHPHPGRPYTGTIRTAYLPSNKEGQKVLRLLNKAFDQKLTFTIGRSSTTGMEDVVTWNDIHHKTSSTGGSTNYGYPDASYLKRVQDELAAKGIKE